MLSFEPVVQLTHHDARKLGSVSSMKWSVNDGIIQLKPLFNQVKDPLRSRSHFQGRPGQEGSSTHRQHYKIQNTLQKALQYYIILNRAMLQ